VVVWQFSGADVERERRALKLIAGSFFLFAAYVAGQAIWDLLARSEPSESLPGIVLAALSLVVMPALAIAKRRVGRKMSSRTVVADGGQTLLCSYLSAVLLVGLVANAALGWWWADPIAGLVIAVLAVREGREAWRGEVCGDAC
jgi:divalent metal cation (Fe/Co/Zn/Cd) transporter